jgi:hypothetical protein
VPVIPGGWLDDGTTLTAPNGHRVVLGFRRYVLTQNWEADNLPLQEENGRSPLEAANPSLGAGTQQIFIRTMLEWTPRSGVFEAGMGAELLQARADLAALQKQLARLQATTSSTTQA